MTTTTTQTTQTIKFSTGVELTMTEGSEDVTMKHPSGRVFILSRKQAQMIIAGHAQ